MRTQEFVIRLMRDVRVFEEIKKGCKILACKRGLNLKAGEIITYEDCPPMIYNHRDVSVLKIKGVRPERFVLYDEI